MKLQAEIVAMKEAAVTSSEYLHSISTLPYHVTGCICLLLVAIQATTGPSTTQELPQSGSPDPGAPFYAKGSGGGSSDYSEDTIRDPFTLSTRDLSSLAGGSRSSRAVGRTWARGAGREGLTPAGRTGSAYCGRDSLTNKYPTRCSQVDAGLGNTFVQELPVRKRQKWYRQLLMPTSSPPPMSASDQVDDDVYAQYATLGSPLLYEQETPPSPPSSSSRRKRRAMPAIEVEGGGGGMSLDTDMRGRRDKQGNITSTAATVAAADIAQASLGFEGNASRGPPGPLHSDAYPGLTLHTSDHIHSANSASGSSTGSDNASAMGDVIDILLSSPAPSPCFRVDTHSPELLPTRMDAVEELRTCPLQACAQNPGDVGDHSDKRLRTLYRVTSSPSTEQSQEASSVPLLLQGLEEGRMNPPQGDRRHDIDLSTLPSTMPPPAVGEENAAERLGAPITIFGEENIVAHSLTRGSYHVDRAYTDRSVNAGCWGWSGMVNPAEKHDSPAVVNVSISSLDPYVVGPRRCGGSHAASAPPHPPAAVGGGNSGDGGGGVGNVTSASGWRDRTSSGDGMAAVAGMGSPGICNSYLCGQDSGVESLSIQEAPHTMDMVPIPPNVPTVDSQQELLPQLVTAAESSVAERDGGGSITCSTSYTSEALATKRRSSANYPLDGSWGWSLMYVPGSVELPMLQVPLAKPEKHHRVHLLEPLIHAFDNDFHSIRPSHLAIPAPCMLRERISSSCACCASRVAALSFPPISLARSWSRNVSNPHIPAVRTPLVEDVDWLHNTL